MNTTKQWAILLISAALCLTTLAGCTKTEDEEVSQETSVEEESSISVPAISAPESSEEESEEESEEASKEESEVESSQEESSEESKEESKEESSQASVPPIVDSAGGGTSGQQSSTGSSSTPKNGDTKVENGVTYSWNALFGWVENTGPGEQYTNDFEPSGNIVGY